MSSKESTETEKQETTFSAPRIWTVTWTALTWLFTFAFMVLLMFIFTNNSSYTKDSDNYSYPKYEVIVKSFGCIEKNQWTDWGTVFNIYKHTTITNVYTAPSGTPAYNAAESTAILNGVMKAMMCHGTNPTTTGTSFPITGGINGSSATDTATAASFKFASDACSCVYDYHTTVFHGHYIYGPPGGVYTAFIDDYLTRGNANFTVPLMKKCFFGKRTTHWLDVKKDCWSSMSPFMVVLYTNTIAGIFGAFYLMDPYSASSTTATTNWGMVGKAVSSPYFFVPFVLVNVALGITGVVYAHESSATLGWMIGIEVTTLLVVSALYYSLKNGSNNFDGKKFARFRSYLYDNTVDLQRVSFWVQYLVTLPGLVLYYDAMQQQRYQDYNFSRILTSVGIGLLAMGYDCICSFYEKVFADKKGSDAHPDIRSAMWWSWGVWMACSASLFYTSDTVSLIWSTSDLVPGSHTLVPLALVVYAIGTPLVSIPELPTMLIGDSEESKHAPLALRLIPDFIARILMIMSVYFWLFFP